MAEYMKMSRRKRGTLMKYVLFICIVIVSFPLFSTCSARPANVINRLSYPDSIGPDPNRLGSASSNGSVRIAVVKPIFTATAHSNAFYTFYDLASKKSNETYIFTDLNYLNVSVKNDWGTSSSLCTFLFRDDAKKGGLILDKTFRIIDEVNVTLGGLFRNEERVYDVLILGFTEYVTQEEYCAYKDFVASGGTLIIMDACNFLAEVGYYAPANASESGTLSLVKGHGWEFNGSCAWRSVYHRWREENKNWVGSNFWHYWVGKHYDYFVANTSHPISAYPRGKFGEKIPSAYAAHEENLLENLTNTEIVGYWHLIDPAEYPGEPIVAYQNSYGNGSVFHSGVMASDVLAYDGCMQTFLLSAVKLALTGKVEDETTQGGNGQEGHNSTYPLPWVIVPIALGTSIFVIGAFVVRNRRIKSRLGKQNSTETRKKTVT